MGFFSCSRFLPVSPCVPLYPLVSLCVPCVPLCPLCPVFPFVSTGVPCVFYVSLCPLVSLVSSCVPCDAWVLLCPLGHLCLLCVLYPLKYMAALPLFFLLCANFDGFHFFHITSCGVFFCTPRRSKDVIFHEKKNSKHKVLLALFRK